MNLSSIRLPALLVFLALSAGCGPNAGQADCVTNCNYRNANCDFGVDCEAQCSSTAADADAAGCASQNDAYSHCLATQVASHPACDMPVCTMEQQNFYACVMPYCDANGGHSPICPPPTP